MKAHWIKVLLRLALSIAFLSAVADRFGFWPAEISVWGNMETFLTYTSSMVPWAPESLVPFMGWSATILEVLFAVLLILGFKTRLTAQLSGILLLIFGLSMAFSFGIKAPLDYSVFSAAAAAFGLSLIKEPFLEVDQFIGKK
ncbi:DoxX family membrane protein [Roseivirga sp.]|uniref:DoxX family membrane protein n=1 Tax=Roseivirga sp. TaxID=1964215 RepID=UPI002B26D158|nr:DoxX family membrane protein [Roseivirga sp.]